MGATSNTHESRLSPFLNWAGGKRWLVCNYADRFPLKFGKYIEPFLGAGSVFFHLRPKTAILGDANPDLVSAYQAIKDDWRALERSLQYRERRHRENADEYYYWLRGVVPRGLTQRASRLIYLNRTCFNGIYRVNRQGQFNVPRGTKDKVIFESDDFESVARLLQGAELIAGDFDALVSRANEGDFVFADPPYTVLHNQNGFRKYNEVLFMWADQQRLARSLHAAARRGAKILCTNANHQSVRSLYESKDFKLDVVSRFSRISAKNSSRKYFDELLIQANI